jgi:hypothetical protein
MKQRAKFQTYQRIIMGKSIALFFASAALVILAGSFVAPRTVAADKSKCSPAYGVDPCTVTSTIPAQH